MATKKSTAAKSTATKIAAKAPAKAAAKKTAAETAHAAAAAKSPATHQQIADLAHKYHTERGHSHGSHVADWLRAEKELNS